jgi:hypothetical protein
MSKEMKHMAGTHAQESAHWSGMAKLFGQMADNHREMHKDAGFGEGEKSAHMTNAECCEKAQKQSDAHAAWHETQADKCNKIAAADFEKRDQIVPDGVSRVTPTIPGLTAVPRHGQREMPANVPPQFAKLVSTSDEEESSLISR